MHQLHTTLGPKSRAELGLILPHEHIFVDLGPIEEAHYKQATAQPVIDLMGPQIQAIQAQGVTALVECTPEGVGRRVDIDKAVSEALNFPIVVPTGIYREPWVPDWAHQASEEALRDWMIRELTEGVGETGVKAAWIKISAGDDGITPVEAKILRAAAQAGRQTGAVIGSHTIRGRVVRDQLDILEAAGYTPERFIWIHTQAEPDFNLHLEMARRGVWLEYDSIGHRADEEYIELIQQVLAAGFGSKLLLSHDRGWYDPSQPGGGTPKPFTHLVAHFLPNLRAAGVDQATIDQLTQENPFTVYAR